MRERTEANAPRGRRARADRWQQHASQAGARIRDRDHAPAPHPEAAEHAVQRAQARSRALPPADRLRARR